MACGARGAGRLDTECHRWPPGGANEAVRQAQPDRDGATAFLGTQDLAKRLVAQARATHERCRLERHLRGLVGNIWGTRALPRQRAAGFANLF